MSEPPAKKEKVEPNTISMVVDRKRYRETEQFSDVHRIGGYPWRLRLTRERSMCLSIICDKSKESELWKCEAIITIGEPFNVSWVRHDFVSWDTDTHVYSSKNKKVIMGTCLKVQISVDDGERWRIRPCLYFCDPNDGTLVIGNEELKIHVNKEFLASASPFFDRLFNGDFKEKNMDEIQIRDVDYKEFSNMYDLATGSRIASLTDSNVHRMLELADRFDIKIVEDKIVSFLLSSSSLSFQQKLLISDQFNISFLKDVLFASNTKLQLLELCKSPEYEQLSKQTISALFDTTLRRYSQLRCPKRKLTSAAKSGGSNMITMTLNEWNANQTVQFSPVHRINGYPWRLKVFRHGAVDLICDKSNESELWKCSALVRQGDTNETELTFASWIDTVESRVAQTNDDHNRVEVRIETKEDGKSWRLRPILDPFVQRDGLLLIGDEKKKLYVDKESLAAQSPFFDRLFNGDSKEKNMNEISIEDVDYEEFSNLLRIAYRFDGASLTDENFERVLQFAARFELKIVEDRVASFILSSPSSFSLQQRLLIAEQYNLSSFKHILHNRFYERWELLELLESPEWNQLSNGTMRNLFFKMCYGVG